MEQYMSKYFRVTADYRPNNPKKPTYDFCVKDNATKKQMKEYFQSVFSWLKVYSVEEIAKEDARL
jgi:ribosomal protein L23